MSLYVLDAFIWILGIRGHIPQSDEFSPLAGRSSVSSSAGAVMRGLLVFIGMVALLSMVLWLAVWLAIKLV